MECSGLETRDTIVCLLKPAQPHLSMTLNSCAGGPGESRLGVEIRPASRPCWLLGCDARDRSRERLSLFALAVGTPEGACSWGAASSEFLPAAHIESAAIQGSLGLCALCTSLDKHSQGLQQGPA